MNGRPNRAKFDDIDADNPQIWNLFEHFTLYMIRRGFRHYSADAILHRVRWETAEPLDDGTKFKVNNNWTAYYARKFHLIYPQYDGFFRNRVSRADE